MVKIVWYKKYLCLGIIVTCDIDEAQRMVNGATMGYTSVIPLFFIGCLTIGYFTKNTMKTSHLRNRFVRSVESTEDTPFPLLNLFDRNIPLYEPRDNFCHQNHVQHLISVLSRTGAFAQRKMVRHWAKTIQQRLNFHLLFFIGKVPISNFTSFMNESKTYGDIVVAEFDDTYANLTLKTGVALQWVTTYCPTAKIVIKCDDDVIIFPEGLTDLLDYAKQSKIEENHILGKTFQDEEARKPVRIKKSKWYLSEKNFPGHVFPVYCNGPTYVIFGNTTIRRLLRSVNEYNYLPIEDMFYTGILAQREGISRHIDPIIGNRFSFKRENSTVACEKELVTVKFIWGLNHVKDYLREYSDCLSRKNLTNSTKST